MFPIPSLTLGRHIPRAIGAAALTVALGIGGLAPDPAAAQSTVGDDTGRAGAVLDRFGLDRPAAADGQSLPEPAWDRPVGADMGDAGNGGPSVDPPLGAVGGTNGGFGGFVADGFEPPAEIRLIAPVARVGDLSLIPAGLEVVLDPGWKSYWRAPGAAGLPPSIEPTQTENLADLTLDYPAPTRFSLFGLDTFGYGERVIYPVTLTPETPGAPLALTATVDLLVCSDICVPVTETVSLDLAAGPADPDPTVTQTLDRWRAQIPQDSFSAGLSVTGAGWDGDALIVTGSADPAIRDREGVDILVEAAGDWFFAAPTVAATDGGASFTARIPPTETGPVAALTDNPIRLTVIADGRALDWQGTVAGQAPPGATPTAGGAAGLTLPTILLFAVLGGLILNAMPCVLPVLSLKFFSLIQDGGKAPAAARRGLLITALGILASFWVLAGGLIAVGMAGGALGWGIQFQQPVFLIFMIGLLALFAANMAGLFEIALPDRIGRVALAGSGGTGWLGQFGTGAFATLLATPCSAPFLGTAVGFALARGPVDILAVFTALAIGFALPYLLVAAVPGAIRLLPRPGPWMVRVKAILAFALIGTAVWLLTVLAVAASPTVAAVVALLTLLSVAAVGLPRLTGRDGLGRPGAGVAAAILIAALAVPAAIRAPTGADIAPTDGAWEAWSVERIDAAVAGGQTVFVDVTADWCLTCIANKRLVLDRGAVAEALAAPEILLLRADWTRPDPAIAAYLAGFGRYGIPFNIVYGPAAPDGIVLPELLSDAAVLAALADADPTALAAADATDPDRTAR